MPKTRRQQAKVRSVAQFSDNGSLLARAVPASELDSDLIKMVIYGPNRVGKTWLACTFPKPLVLVCFELSPTGGARTVKKVPGVDVIRVVPSDRKKLRKGEIRYTDCDQYCADLLGSNYLTAVVDSVTSMQDMVLKEILGWSQLPDQIEVGTITTDQYRERSEITRKILRGFINLPMHTIFTAKEKDMNPPEEKKVSKRGKPVPDMRPKFIRGMQLESFVAPELGGATVGWLLDCCDYIGRLYMDKEVETVTNRLEINGKEHISEDWVETGRFVRCLRCQYHPNFAAGFRSEHPEAVPEVIVEPTYEKIAAVIRGEKLNQN